MTIFAKNTFTLLLILGVALPSFSQDSLSIDGHTLAGDDSLKGRQLLNDDIAPASGFWTTAREKPGNYSASNLFVKVVSIAYPIESPHFRTAYADSIFAYIDTLAATHADRNVRAEFIYKGLQLAAQLNRNRTAARYYSLLTSDYGKSAYTARATEYAPDRSIQSGKPMPEFSLPALEDTTRVITNEDFKGDIYLVDIWGTWCGPCIEEMPYLHKAYDRYHATGLTILSIALHDTYNAVTDFRQNEWPMPWNHVFIKDNSASEQDVISTFEVYKVPKTILVNREGTIIATDTDLRGERLLSTLEEVFNE